MRAHYTDSFELMVLVGSLGVVGLLGWNVVGRWWDVARGGAGSAELVSVLLLTALVVGIVVYATIGRWLQARARTERVQYVLTNRRVAIRDEDARYPVMQRRLTPDMEVWPFVHKSGRGSITFATVRPPITANSPGTVSFGGLTRQDYQVNGRPYGEFRFEGLERADQVLGLMAEAVTAQMSDRRHPRPPRWVVEGRRYRAKQALQDD